jgi:hypothetical protein
MLIIKKSIADMLKLVVGGMMEPEGNTYYMMACKYKSHAAGSHITVRSVEVTQNAHKANRTVLAPKQIFVG